MELPVPNCPGWSVYNAAVHVGRVGIAWRSMILATPDEPDSRTRGYAEAEARGTGQAPDVLASWAHQAIDEMESDLDRPCYFSMTGGAGTVGLWGWHAASELAVLRLDIQDALGERQQLTDDIACDAIDYACEYFLPAMARVTATNPGALGIAAERSDGRVHQKLVAVDGDDGEVTTLSGSPVDVLLTLWGRPHGPIQTAGPAHVADGWFVLPASAFQLGTWD